MGFVMKKFRYYICARDMICIAHGDMHRVKWYVKKPKVCEDVYCDINQIVEVIVSIVNPISNGKGERTGKKLDSSGKERKMASKELPRLPRNSTARRKKSARKKIIT